MMPIRGILTILLRFLGLGANLQGRLCNNTACKAWAGPPVLRGFDGRVVLFPGRPSSIYSLMATQTTRVNAFFTDAGTSELETKIGPPDFAGSTPLISAVGVQQYDQTVLVTADRQGHLAGLQLNKKNTSMLQGRHVWDLDKLVIDYSNHHPIYGEAVQFRAKEFDVMVYTNLAHNGSWGRERIPGHLHVLVQNVRLGADELADGLLGRSLQGLGQQVPKARSYLQAQDPLPVQQARLADLEEDFFVPQMFTS